MAVVEDFFDIIYSMHVESSSEPGKAPKHAGQKKTYRAVRVPPGSKGTEGWGAGCRRDGDGGAGRREPLAGGRGEGQSCLPVQAGVRKEAVKGRAAVLGRWVTGLQGQHKGTAAGRGNTE